MNNTGGNPTSDQANGYSRFNSDDQAEIQQTKEEHLLPKENTEVDVQSYHYAKKVTRSSFIEDFDTPKQNDNGDARDDLEDLLDTTGSVREGEHLNQREMQLQFKDSVPGAKLRRYEGLGNFNEPYLKKRRGCLCCTRLKSIQVFRIVSLIVNIPMMVGPMISNGPAFAMEYATQWAIFMNMATFILTYFSGRNPESYKTFASAMIIQQVAIAWQCMVTFVFWVFVAPTYFFSITFYWQLGLSTAHTLPLVFLLINFYLTDNQPILSDWWHCSILAVLYISDNYMFSQIEDRPVYPFLTWDPPSKSIFNCLLCYFFAYGSYVLVVLLTRKCKGRPVCGIRRDEDDEDDEPTGDKQVRPAIQ